MDLWVRIDDTKGDSDSKILSRFEFLDRLPRMRKIYQKALEKEEKEIQMGVEREKDPFFVAPTESLIGKASVALGGLKFLLSVQEIVPIINRKGECCGELALEITPCLPTPESIKKGVRQYHRLVF